MGDERWAMGCGRGTIGRAEVEKRGSWEMKRPFGWLN